jgi:tripeptide aminopeptidase
MKKKVVERFLRYIKHNTQSDSKTGLTPSTPGQLVFAEMLAEELRTIGMEEVDLDDNGYLMATLPSNIEYGVPTIGFIAHMDTSPDFSGKNISPEFVDDYDGGDIILNEEKNIILSPEKFPDLKRYVGQQLIVTDGTTLLGADDKAGIAEIVTAMEYLINNPKIKHGKIRIGFTPDEEIGAGANYFDVKKFGAEFAYTMDGSGLGELQYENFNAAGAKIIVNGISVHPGYAKHKMVNSMRIANQFVTMLPRHETPEHTDGYEGFYHLIGMNGTVERTELEYIIRDFKKDRFEDRKKEIEHIVRKVNAEFGEGTVVLELKDQYYNMREKVKPAIHVVDIAEKAMKEVGVTPNIKPIRGGTDGARLSFMGLPCPNIFGGGHNFHGKFEYIPTPSMNKACKVILKIVENVGKG